VGLIWTTVSPTAAFIYAAAWTMLAAATALRTKLLAPG